MKEIKAFAPGENLIDRGVGIIIGGAFDKIVTSLVKGGGMPPMGMLPGVQNFMNQVLRLGASDKAAAFEYGALLKTAVDFMIAVLMLFRAVNKARSLVLQDSSPMRKNCPQRHHCRPELEPAGR